MQKILLFISFFSSSSVVLLTHTLLAFCFWWTQHTRQCRPSVSVAGLEISSTTYIRKTLLTKETNFAMFIHLEVVQDSHLNLAYSWMWRQTSFLSATTVSTTDEKGQALLEYRSPSQLIFQQLISQEQRLLWRESSRLGLYIFYSVWELSLRFDGLPCKICILETVPRQTADWTVLISFTVFSEQHALWNTFSQVPWPAASGAVGATCPCLVCSSSLCGSSLCGSSLCSSSLCSSSLCGSLTLALLPQALFTFIKLLSPQVNTGKTGASLTQPHRHRYSPSGWRLSQCVSLHCCWILVHWLRHSVAFLWLLSFAGMAQINIRQRAWEDFSPVLLSLLVPSEYQPLLLPYGSTSLIPATHNPSFSAALKTQLPFPCVSLLSLGCVPQLFVMC